MIENAASRTVLSYVDSETKRHRVRGAKLHALLTRYGDSLLCRMFYLTDIAECLLVHADAQAMQWQTYGSIIRGGSPAEIVPVLDRVIEQFEMGFLKACIVWFAISQNPMMTFLWDRYIEILKCMKALRDRYRARSS